MAGNTKMLWQEFVIRTGFEPTFEEYAEIEEAYYHFDGNKDAFCEDFVKNGGEQKIYDARAKKIEQLRSKMAEMEKNFMTTIKRQAELIESLKHDLEVEQEWKPYENERNVKQSEYEQLAQCVGKCGARYMTDAEAIDWVVQETGFARERIQIVHELPMEEINRHHQVRRTGKMFDRRPIYDATDYHYIVFNIRANVTHGWELHNDELTPYWD